MAQPQIRVAFLLADDGHDPTETAIPFTTFADAGFSITILTETGATPTCDARMLSGWTGKLLGASGDAAAAYKTMTAGPEWQHAQAWTSTSPQGFDVLFLPGGHDKAVRQLLDSGSAQDFVREFWPGVAKTHAPPRVCAAVCHGVQLLAHTKLAESQEGDEEKEKSVLHDVRTTALTGLMESSAYNLTRLVLGDYYKTYGAGTPNVEEVVKRSLDDAATQWVGSASLRTPLVVADDRYNYLSGRWPGDAQALADAVVKRVREVRGG